MKLRQTIFEKCFVYWKNQFQYYICRRKIAKFAWAICQRAGFSNLPNTIHAINRTKRLVPFVANEPIYPQTLLHHVAFVKNHIERQINISITDSKPKNSGRHHDLCEQNKCWSFFQNSSWLLPQSPTEFTCPYSYRSISPYMNHEAHDSSKEGVPGLWLRLKEIRDVRPSSPPPPTACYYCYMEKI